MEKTKSSSASIFGQFVRQSPNFAEINASRVLLRMPGCHEVFVNDAHRRAFPAWFRTVSSKEEMEKALTRELTISSSEGLLQELPCYCYPMKAIVAFIGKHCVFERSLQLLQSDTGIHEDIAAFLVRQNGERAYHLYRARVNRAGRSADYLDAELSRILGLRVSVVTERSKFGVPHVLLARTTLDDFQFMEPVRLDVSLEPGYEGYAVMSKTLKKVIQDLGSASSATTGKPAKDLLRASRAELLATVKSHRHLIDYEAVLGFLNGIFGNLPPFADQKKTDEVVFELKEIQERLFDAFVVMDVVAKKVFNKMQEWANVKP